MPQYALIERLFGYQYPQLFIILYAVHLRIYAMIILFVLFQRIKWIMTMMTIMEKLKNAHTSLLFITLKQVRLDTQQLDLSEE